ncbi:MAG TPA: glycosyl hydrolase family 18 protein [Rhodanobacteraceae bacterium]
MNQTILQRRTPARLTRLLLVTACALAFAQMAHAADSTVPCDGIGAWSATTVYTGGDQATYDNQLYRANWWTLNGNPATHSGQWQEWSLEGTCSGSAPAPAPTPAPSPAPTPSPSPAPAPTPAPSPAPTPAPAPAPTPAPSPAPTPAPAPAPTPAPAPAPTPAGKHLMIGYWHDFDNGSGIFRIADVPNTWDVIIVAFASDAGNGNVSFTLDPALDKQQFIADIAAKEAAGKKVLLSFGGQNGTVTLNNATEVANFVSSTAAILNEYGFDGIDLDLESGAGVTSGAPIQTNIVTAVKDLKQQFPNLFLTMAPEFPYVQGGYVAYAGIWGAYLPIINGLRDDLNVLQVQLYNNGGLNTPYETSAIPAATEDMLVGSVKMLVEGFPLSYGNAGTFAPLPASKVALGLPSGPHAASSGYATPAVVNATLDCITTDTHCATIHLTTPQPTFRGVMSWSINWDKYSGQAFSSSVGAKVHSLP